MQAVKTVWVLVMVSSIPCNIESSQMSCKRNSKPSSRANIPNDASFLLRSNQVHDVMDDRKINDIIEQSILDVQTSHDSFTNSNKTVYSRGNKHSTAMELRNLIFRKIIDNIEEEDEILDFRVIEQVNEKLSLALKRYTESHSSDIKNKEFELHKNLTLQQRQLFTNECNMKHFLMVNEPNYFPTGFPDPDPCSSSTEAIIAKKCQDNKLYKYFRTQNGDCNNPNNPRWGATVSKLERLLPRQHTKLRTTTYDSLPPPKDTEQRIDPLSDCNDSTWRCTFWKDNGYCYSDYVRDRCAKSCEVCVVSSATQSCPANCQSQNDGCQDETTALPNARLASSQLHPDQNIPEDNLNLIVMQFGQFLDHDISLSPDHENSNCCGNPADKNSPNHDAECYPIPVPSNDPFYLRHGQTCLEFTRTIPYCSNSGSSLSDVRDNMNIITSFLDSSNVYGSEKQNDITDIHFRTYQGGKMKVNNENLLPSEGHCRAPIAGDIRAAENPGLTSLHALFVREHNRICDLLIFEPINWFALGKKDCVRDHCDELIYQNARRIVIAEWQNIIYEEWLPIILGPQSMRDHDLNLDFSSGSSFNPEINPGILASFSTAAFRFGHSMIQSLVNKHDVNGGLEKTFAVSDALFNPKEYYENGGMEKLLSGMTRQPSQKADKFVTEEVTNLLFKEKKNFGHDLIARNIQRGRDHGLPSYAEFYKKFGPQSDPNRDMSCWNRRPESFSQSDWDALKRVYVHPHDIELFSGGLMEKRTNGEGILGPLFRKIISIQFNNLKVGDRFFFTHQGQSNSFNQDALQTIKNRKLSDIICDNTNIKEVPSNVFINNNDPSNSIKRCNTNDVNNLEFHKINFILVTSNGDSGSSGGGSGGNGGGSGGGSGGNGGGSNGGSGGSSGGGSGGNGGGNQVNGNWPKSAYRVSSATNPFRWKIDNDRTSTFGWNQQYTFYAFSSHRPGTSTYSVLFATNPDRNRFSYELHRSSRPWTFKFTFYAFNSQQPNTIPYSVAIADNPTRYRLSTDEHTSNNGWTHLFTFYAYPNP